MNPVIWFSIIGVSCLIVFLPQFISYQMCQSITPLQQFDMAHSTQATQEQIFALKMQLDMANFNMALQRQMQSYVVPMPTYYSPYMQPSYLTAFPSPLTQRCCNYGNLTHWP